MTLLRKRFVGVAFGVLAASAVAMPHVQAQVSAGPGTPYAAARNLTNRSGTLAVGGSAQTLMAANAQRHGCAVQNKSSGDLYINDLGAATGGTADWLVPSGSFFSCAQTGTPTGALSIYGLASGAAFAAREW